MAAGRQQPRSQIVSHVCVGGGAWLWVGGECDCAVALQVRCLISGGHSSPVETSNVGSVQKVIPRVKF